MKATRSRHHTEDNIKKIIINKVTNNINVLQQKYKVDFTQRNTKDLINLAIKYNKRDFLSISDEDIQDALMNFSKHKDLPDIFFLRPCCSKFPGTWPFCQKTC